MVQDIRAERDGIVRDRVDAIIEGREYIEPQSIPDPALAPNTATPTSDPASRLSTANQPYYEPDPETWGTSKEAVAGKKALDDLLSGLPKRKGRTTPPRRRQEQQTGGEPT